MLAGFLFYVDSQGYFWYSLPRSDIRTCLPAGRYSRVITQKGNTDAPIVHS